MGNLTANISNYELECPCCGLNKTDTGIIHRVQTVCDILHGIVKHVRNIDDFRIILIINSATRCWKHHCEIYEELGKTPPMDSYHLALPDNDMKSYALDVWFRVKIGNKKYPLNNMEIIILNKLLDNWSGGFHFYGDFWHFDIGSKKRRW